MEVRSVSKVFQRMSLLDAVLYYLRNVARFLDNDSSYYWDSDLLVLPFETYECVWLLALFLFATVRVSSSNGTLGGREY